jgi:pilus assembly protein CpaB
MNSSRVIILGVAVVAAVGAGYVAKNMMAPPPPQIIVQEGPSTPSIQLADVLVLKEDVAMGTSVTDKLVWQSWPADALDERFIRRDQEENALEEMNASVARVPLYSGEPLRKSKLIGGGQSFLSSILPAGKRAVATQIAADTSAGGFILPNDYVDVIMTRRSGNAGGSGSGDGFITETILKNIRVLAIDQAIREDEEGRKVRVGDTATLELTPQQAEIITVAAQMADRLTLALRAVVDAQEPVESSGEYLVSGNGRRGTVRLIRNGEVTEVGAR